MIGLMVLFVMLIYFIALFWVTRKFYKVAKNKGKSIKIAYLHGLLGFSLVFLPVFWDFIPNRISFYYYCKNDAPLKVYKTLEQWKLENPGVFETLQPLGKEGESIFYTNSKIINGKTYSGRSISSNQRLGLYSPSSTFEYLPFQIRRRALVLYDYVKEDILAIQHDIYSGPGNVIELGGEGYKIWLNKECKNNESKSNEISIFKFAEQFNIYSD